MFPTEPAVGPLLQGGLATEGRVPPILVYAGAPVNVGVGVRPLRIGFSSLVHRFYQYFRMKWTTAHMMNPQNPSQQRMGTSTTRSFANFYFSLMRSVPRA